jgi:hypothetical protein
MNPLAHYLGYGPALRAFTSLRDVSLRRNRPRRLSLPPKGVVLLEAARRTAAGA